MEIKISGPGAETAKEMAGAARGALRRVFGPALEEFGLTLGDQMRAFRLGNLLRLDAKLKRVAANYGRTPEALNMLPIGDAIRVVEAASFEEEEDVQELWARLIVKAASATEQKQRRVDKLYVELLAALSPAEAAYLELLGQGPQGKTFKTTADVQTFNKGADDLAESKWRKFAPEIREVAIQNLSRLRCICPTPRHLIADRLLVQFPKPRDWRGPNGALVDVDQMNRLLAELVGRIQLATGAIEPANDGPLPLMVQSAFGPRHFGASIEAPEFNYMLTQIGTSLINAVTLTENVAPPDDEAPE